MPGVDGPFACFAVMGLVRERSEESPLRDDLDITRKTIAAAIAMARAQKPAYNELCDLLEPLFILQSEVLQTVRLKPISMTRSDAENKWKEGIPLLKRWDFPLDIQSAEAVLDGVKLHIPTANVPLSGAQGALNRALEIHPAQKEAIWDSFLQHEFEPWEEWVDAGETDAASLLFLARSCLRPSIEWTAMDLVERCPVPKEWLRGYCPVCGSLPSLLYLMGEGERLARCSWCGASWNLYRFQCPFCDNRHHDSLGYLYVEEEPRNRIQYCQSCKNYFKLLDVRERFDPPFGPLEEWITLHLDILAQRAGWQQPPSPSPAVYG